MSPRSSAPRPLVPRLLALLRRPLGEWTLIAREHEPPLRLFLRYAAPLSLAPTVARWDGLSLRGARDGSGAFVLTPAALGLDAVLGWASTLAALGVLTALIALCARVARLRAARGDAARLAIYASTAGWVGGLSNLAPGARPLGALAALYGVVLFVGGARTLLGLSSRSLALFSACVLALFAACELVLTAVLRAALAMA